jgi:hypothetical protein
MLSRPFLLSTPAVTGKTLYAIATNIIPTESRSNYSENQQVTGFAYRKYTFIKIDTYKEGLGNDL